LLIDYCIAGLGNPGLKYFNTRHNIGFHVIDKLAEFFKIENFIEEDSYGAAHTEYNGKNLVLLKPLTYMNGSGRAVKHFSDRYEVPAEKFLIIFDDVNIDFGTLRIRPGGSDGGHNGMSSVIYEMMSEDIPRLRIGIKNDSEIEKLRNENGVDLAEFVLSEFTPEETKDIGKVISESKNALLFYIDEGITAAMNKFNRNILASNGENNTNLL
jgi:PTH1 family peptidyl-tRNA hydrolase